MVGILEMLNLGMHDILMIETFCFLLIATIQDFRKREVSDLLNYTFVITSLFLRVIWFAVEGDINTVLLVIPSAAVFFGFSYLMYRAGQWGGGDVKLAVGVSIALADSISSLLGFFMNLIIIGAIYGLIYTLLVGIRCWKKVVENINVFWAVLSIICVSLAVYLYFLLPIPLAPLAAFFLILFASIKYIEVIEKVCFVKMVPVERLVEGDWLVDEIDGIKKLGIGLVKEDIDKIKAKGLKKVMIKEGVPFIPAFLLAFLTSLFLGNVFLNLASLYQYLGGLSPIS